uniref:Uncharacterized protein n=1 Tax=Anguilla anguilla TaxID=7936 RepID=A0A0E9RTF0_ANGAN
MMDSTGEHIPVQPSRIVEEAMPMPV